MDSDDPYWSGDFSVEVTSAPTSGTASCSYGYWYSSYLSCTYTPDGPHDVAATDAFTVTIDDGHGGSDTATVDVTVEANSAPAAAERHPHRARNRAGLRVGHRQRHRRRW